MSPDLLLRLILTGLGPDEVVARMNPYVLATQLLGPVGGVAGRPYGLWGSLYGQISVPQLSEAEILRLLLPHVLR